MTAWYGGTSRYREFGGQQPQGLPIFCGYRFIAQLSGESNTPATVVHSSNDFISVFIEAAWIWRNAELRTVGSYACRRAVRTGFLDEAWSAPFSPSAQRGG
jgi:hypothetical protein